MKAKKVVICGLARDCADKLLNIIPKLEDLCLQFTDSSIIIVENDSIDNTKVLLTQWADRNPYVKILNCDNSSFLSDAKKVEQEKGLSRITRMSHFRNVYLSEINSLTTPPDLVIVIDIDILDFDVKKMITAIAKAPVDAGGIFANGIFTVFGKDSDWTYDTYAFLNHETDITSERYWFYYRLYLSKIINVNDFTECDSAFGGIAVYNYEAIKGLKYRAQVDRAMVLCEHVPFNLEVKRRGYRLYIAKDIKVRVAKAPFKLILRSCFGFNSILFRHS